LTVSETAPLRTISWADFSQLEPELAEFGTERLHRKPSYLATVRRSGMPRVHPVTPIITSRGLYLFMEPTSPKRKDLLANGLYSLHNGVADNAGTGGEFSCSGRGIPVDDTETWAHVADASGYEPLARYIVFEFQLSEARCHGYGDVAMPQTQRWVASP
jgi:hypothetical protein